LAALDLRADVEQPCGCLIAQHRQAVQSNGEVGGLDIGRHHCSSTPHSQAAEEAIPHLYKKEQKLQTPARRWLSWTQAVLERVIPEGWVPVS